MYLALSGRIAKTESTLFSLTAQVAELTRIVKTTSQSIPISSSTSVGGSASLFSPYDENVPLAHSTVAEGTAVGNGGNGQDSSIAALTQQISALSTSVAQLQRLQQSQSTLARTASTTPSGPFGASQTLPSISSLAHPGNLPIGSRFMPHSASDLISGPLTTPSNMMGPPLSPIPPQGPKREMQMQFPGPPLSSSGGGGRPNINRSISSSVIGIPQDGESKWGNQGRMGGPGHLQMPNMGGVAERVWSPGGMMTPTVSMSGAMANALGGSGGAAAPGAGIVVTKWEHLNLKVDLLRAVNKYGYVNEDPILMAFG